MSNHGINLLGQTFGHLTVLGSAPKKDRALAWTCLCSCGALIERRGYVLTRSGESTSCGCQDARPHRQSVGEASKSALYLKYQITAHKRGLEFSLTRTQFLALTGADCFYCGVAPSQLYGGKTANGRYRYNGIDRVNNGRGYHEDNTRSCCGVCNRAKSTLTENQFYDWVARVHARRVL